MEICLLSSGLLPELRPACCRDVGPLVGQVFGMVRAICRKMNLVRAATSSIYRLRRVCRRLFLFHLCPPRRPLVFCILFAIFVFVFFVRVLVIRLLIACAGVFAVLFVPPWSPGRRSRRGSPLYARARDPTIRMATIRCFKSQIDLMLAWPSLSAAPDVSSTGAT